MKNIILPTLLLLSVNAISQSFCGTISMKINKAGQGTDLKMYACDNNLAVRYELGSKEGKATTDYIINRTSDQKFLRTQLNGETKVVPVSNEMVKGDIVITSAIKTGEKGIKNGYHAEQIKVEHSNGNITEAWVATEFSLDFGGLSKYFQDDAAAQGMSKLGLSGIPVSAVTFDKLGNVIFSYGITQISTDPVDSSIFIVASNN